MAITSPADIPGLVLWLSAGQETAFADGAQMNTQWTDRSGKGFHATAGKSGANYMVWHATGGPNNGPYIQSNSSGYFTLPSLATMRPAATGGEVVASIMGPATGDDWAMWDWGNQNQGFPNTGQVHEDFGKDSLHPRMGFTQYAEIRSWHRYGVWNNTSYDMGIHVNGTTRATQGDYNPTFTYASPHIGYVPLNGQTAQTIRYAAVVMYNHKLTATQRADLDTWLAANPSGGGPAAPTGPTITWFDGTTRQSATLKGWWDGSAIQPLT